MTLDVVPHVAALDAGAEGRLRTLRQLLDLRMELMLSQLPPGSAELTSAGRRACGMWSGAADGYGHQGGGREKVDVLLRAVDLEHYAAAIVANGYVSSEDLSDADNDELSELAQRLCMKRPEERRLLKAVAAARAETAARTSSSRPAAPEQQHRPNRQRETRAQAVAASTNGGGGGGELPAAELGVDMAPDEVNAARNIQARHRGRTARRQVNQMRREQSGAALRIQSVHRGKAARKRTSEMQLRRAQGQPELVDEEEHEELFGRRPRGSPNLRKGPRN